MPTRNSQRSSRRSTAEASRSSRRNRWSFRQAGEGAIDRVTSPVVDDRELVVQVRGEAVDEGHVQRAVEVHFTAVDDDDLAVLGWVPAVRPPTCSYRVPVKVTLWLITFSIGIDANAGETSRAGDVFSPASLPVTFFLLLLDAVYGDARCLSVLAFSGPIAGSTFRAASSAFCYLVGLNK